MSISTGKYQYIVIILVIMMKISTGEYQYMVIILVIMMKMLVIMMKFLPGSISSRSEKGGM